MTATQQVTPKLRRRAEHENRMLDRAQERESLAAKVAELRVAEAGKATAATVAALKRLPVLFPIPSKVSREAFLERAAERAPATQAPIPSDLLRALMGRAGVPVPPAASRIMDAVEAAP